MIESHAYGVLKGTLPVFVQEAAPASDREGERLPRVIASQYRKAQKKDDIPKQSPDEKQEKQERDPPRESKGEKEGGETALYHNQPVWARMSGFSWWPCWVNYFDHRDKMFHVFFGSVTQSTLVS